MIYTKYPKTPHLPWSPAVSRSDKVLKDVDHFKGKKIIATIKMDGENTTIYKDYIHARSIDSRDHPSRHWVKKLQHDIGYHIPDGWRICGENLFAKHSIYYESLLSYFLAFSVWNDHNECISYLDTISFCYELGLEVVLPMHIGIWTDETPQLLNERFHVMHYNAEDHEEGYVVRLYDSFKYENFEKSVAKYVREAHVQTDEHWMHKQIIQNRLYNMPK